MNIGEFRSVMDTALRSEGFDAQPLSRKSLKAWSLPAGDAIPFFSPHAFRRPWGFVYSGFIGVEIPELREWLDKHKPGEDAGIFHTCFVGYVIANEDILGRFMLSHGDPVPADLWAGLLKDRILQVPTSLNVLIATYRRDREKLGWLAHPHTKPAWNFLLKWHEHPDPSLQVPRMLPDGRIV